MKKQLLLCSILAAILTSAIAAQEPPTRDMNAINWMDFKEWVPSRIDTVLIAVGTLEAHGVANNGADNTVPETMVRDLAPRLNALTAPTIPYGVTTSLSAFAGTFRISRPVFQAYCHEVLEGLAGTGFKNIVIVNGHGPNFEPLQEAAAEISEKTGARTLVFNWWSHTADITKEVFGTDGGHAGVNENAAVLATTPDYVREDLYKAEQAWWRQDGVAAYPFPSSIILYEKEEGFPDFDQAKAKQFYGKVLDKLEVLIKTTIEKWNLAGL